MLSGGSVQDTVTNLKDAAAGENYEWTLMYATFAKEAKEEGFHKIAYLFEQVGKIEKDHEARYLKLIKKFRKWSCFCPWGKTIWLCTN